MIKHTAVLALLLLLLTGCGEKVLYSSLSEQEANAMVAVLYNEGIAAEKQGTIDEGFSVLTAKQSFSRAVELLRSNGYPRNKFESLGDVFKKEGFVSSPLEERARLNYAQSQELAKTLESIDGVILARVHLAVPKKDPLSEDAKPASASIFIKHQRGIKLGERESQIKALIVNSIEGLPYENVTVAMFPSEPSPMPNKPSQEAASLKSSFAEMPSTAGVLMGGSTALLGGVGAWWWLRRRKNNSGNVLKVQEHHEKHR